MKKARDKKAKDRKARLKEQKDRKPFGPGNRQFLYLMNMIVLCCVTLLSLAAAGIFLLRARDAAAQSTSLQSELDAVKGSAKTLYTEDEVSARESQARDDGATAEKRKILMQIQSSMESGGSTASMLRSLFSEDIVVVNGGKYYFYPILNAVKRNSFQQDDFSLTDDGRLQYIGSDKVTLQSGVNVSEENGDIDWQLVSEDDVSFAMICAGGRESDDSGKSRVFEDQNLEDNINGASEAGLHVGVYYILDLSEKDEVQEEAEELVQRLDAYQSKISYPIALWVNAPSEEDRHAYQSKADWTDYVISFCDVLEDAGYEPMIYGNLASFVMMLNIENLEKYDKWISNTGASLYFPYRFSMWQYSSAGTVHGISTEVGLDVSLSVMN